MVMDGTYYHVDLLCSVCCLFHCIIRRRNDDDDDDRRLLRSHNRVRERGSNNSSAIDSYCENEDAAAVRLVVRIVDAKEDEEATRSYIRLLACRVVSLPSLVPYADEEEGDDEDEDGSNESEDNHKLEMDGLEA